MRDVQNSRAWSWRKVVAICCAVQAAQVLLFKREVLESPRLILIQLASALFIAFSLLLAGRALANVANARRRK
jgi:hypothetical protein